MTPRSTVWVFAARSCQAMPLIEVTSTVIPASAPNSSAERTTVCWLMDVIIAP